MGGKEKEPLPAAGGFLYLESTSMPPAVDTEQATLLYIYGAAAFSIIMRF